MKLKHPEEDLIPLPATSDDSESEVSEKEFSEDDLNQDEVSDSDSEPECFSFAATQEKRQKDQKLTLHAIKLQKEELKRKRQEIVLQNIKQREEKRRKIESKRLPEELLEKLNDKEEHETHIDKTEETDTVENDEEDSEKEITETAGNVTFKCKVLPVEAQKPKYIPKTVSNFKEQMLYGGRIRREKCNRDAVLKREKQLVRTKNKPQ